MSKKTKRNSTATNSKSLKKRSSSTSPTFDASEYKFQVIKGKDGFYVSDQDYHDVFVWEKIKDPVRARLWLKFNTPVDPKTIKTPKSKYITLDNGDRPYVVYDYGNKIDVYFNRNTAENKKDGSSTFTLQGKIMEISYKKIFVGENYLESSRKHDKGSSIVVETSPLHYTFIGDCIFEFRTLDPIKILYSPVGNSAVPYPYAVGETNTYLLTPQYLYIPNENIDLTQDVYDQYYADVKRFRKGIAKPFKIKLIYKREQLSSNHP